MVQLAQHWTSSSKYWGSVWYQTVLYDKITNIALEETDGFKDFFDIIVKKHKQLDSKFSSNPIVLDILTFTKKYLIDSPIICDLLQLLLKVVDEILL